MTASRVAAADEGGGVSGAGPYRGAEYGRLLEASRRSLERTGGDLSGQVSLAGPDEAERRAIIGITGQYRAATTGRISVRLADLDAAVRAATGGGLIDLLTALHGPVRDRPAERAAGAAARAELERLVRGSRLHDEHHWYRAWLDGIAGDGTLTRLIGAGQRERLVQAVAVLERLAARPPGAPPVLLAELAAVVTGDTKALNHPGVLSSLVLRAFAAKTGAEERPESAEERRLLWEADDVVPDDLASRVLVLNLPAAGDGLGEWLTGAAARGTPFQVTLHQLVTLPIRVPGGVVVRVCENPAVLRRAAADLGAGSAPLVCGEGRPSAAFHRLARAITGGGGELRYHGDFDWPGVSIADDVIRRHGARPWRMSAADYLAGAALDGEHLPLAGQRAATPWDLELGEVMAATGRVVYEESVAGALISDLAS